MVRARACIFSLRARASPRARSVLRPQCWWHPCNAVVVRSARRLSAAARPTLIMIVPLLRAALTNRLDEHTPHSGYRRAFRRCSLMPSRHSTSLPSRRPPRSLLISDGLRCDAVLMHVDADVAYYHVVQMDTHTCLREPSGSRCTHSNRSSRKQVTCQCGISRDEHASKVCVVEPIRSRAFCARQRPAT